MKKPACSIVIPNRDCLDYLLTALESIRVQEIENLEIIVVDDGSSDGSIEFLEDMAQRENGFVFLKSYGIGPGGARNLALEYAKSDLVAFLDADDVWRPGKLKEQLAYHRQRPEVVLSFTNYLHVDPDGKNYGTAFEFWKDVFVSPSVSMFEEMHAPEAEILSANVIGTSSVVARLDALRNANGFSLTLPSASDWDLWLRLAEQGLVGCTSEVLMDYLMRPGSVTRRRGARISAMEAIVSRYQDRDDAEIRNAVRIARANIDVARAEMAREEGAPWRSLVAHGMAFSRWPNRRLARAAASDLVHGCRSLFQPEVRAQ